MELPSSTMRGSILLDSSLAQDMDTKEANHSLRAVLIDDNPDDRALVLRELRREFPNLDAREVADADTLERILSSPPFDLVITDFQLRWSDGLQTLRRVKRLWPDCPVIMFTGTGSEEIAVEAMKAGLDDYVLKSPKHFARLPSVARLVLQMARQKRQLKQAEARYSSLFDSVPVGLYRATPQGQILDANPALIEMLRYPNEQAVLDVNLADLYGNVADYQSWLELMHTHRVTYNFEAPLRTFTGETCWAENSARAVFETDSEELTYEGSFENITGRKRAEGEREHLIQELQEALGTVKALRGLLPICASCKRIRDDRGVWTQIESFIQAHSNAEFTHSFCPECMRHLYPEIFENQGRRQD